jgi:integrase
VQAHRTLTLIPNYAHLPLEEFNARHLRDLAQQVLETPPKYGFSEKQPRIGIEMLSNDELRRRKRTFNSLVTILKMAFKHAWDNAAIESERPWRCLKRIPVNHSPRTIFLDRNECRRLLKECTPELRNLVLAALYSGCRVGELGNLIVSDVGKQGFGIRVAAFKRSPARFVFLPDEGMAFLLGQCEGKSAQDYVLKSDMGKPWRKQHTQLFRRAVARAGLPRELVFHGLRHTYASDLVRAGVPLDIVAKQLGHASSITVSNTYGHLAEQYREEQVRTKFSPLSQQQLQEAEMRRPELEKLWSNVQSQDWRQYAQVERERFLLQRLTLHRDPEDKFIGAFLRPPLYSTAFDAGFGTLYTAVYRPRLQQMEVRWPGTIWNLDMDNFQEGGRRVQIPGAA